MAPKQPSNQKILDKLNEMGGKVLSIEEKMLTKQEFKQFKAEEFQPLKTTVDNLNTTVDSLKDTVDSHTEILDSISKGVQDLQQENVVRSKTFARLNHRTEKFLGNHLEEVDAEFEEKYQGEDELRKAEAEG